LDNVIVCLQPKHNQTIANPLPGVSRDWIRQLFTYLSVFPCQHPLCYTHGWPCNLTTEIERRSHRDSSVVLKQCYFSWMFCFVFAANNVHFLVVGLFKATWIQDPLILDTKGTPGRRLDYCNAVLSTRCWGSCGVSCVRN